MSDLGDTFNVIDYGADNTGSSDSASGINSAVAAAHTAGGGIVLFPPGDYLVSSTSLNLVSNVVYWGYGASIVGETGSSALLSYVNTTQGGVGLENALIAGLTLIQNNSSSTGQGILLESQNNYNVTIRDVEILPSSSSAQPCIAIGYLDTTGSFVNNHSERIHLDHCTINGGTFSSTPAVNLISCDESTMVNCKFFNIMASAVNLVAINGYCIGVSALGNTFRKCASSIVVEQASYVVISGNSFRSESEVDEIDLVNCQNIQIVSNSFAGQSNSNAIEMYDLSAHDSTFGPSANIIIGSNVFTNYAYALYVQAAGGSVTASQSNVVFTNNLPTNVTGAPSVPGTVGYTAHDNP